MQKIENKEIGDGKPVFIVFEAGATHTGIKSAKKLKNEYNLVLSSHAPPNRGLLHVEISYPVNKVVKSINRNARFLI